MRKEITIREVTADDWQIYANLRLFALKDAPRGFGNTYEVEKEYAPSQWKTWFGDRKYVILVAYEKEHPIGMAVLIDNLDNPVTGEIVSLFVKELHRNQGLSKALLASCISHACRNKKWEKLEARCRDGNSASQNTISAMGFKLERSVMATWPGAVQDLRHDYLIDLSRLRMQGVRTVNPENRTVI